MKNLSIRTKILAGIVIVNLLGALTVAVYLHQSYSGSLDIHAVRWIDEVLDIALVSPIVPLAPAPQDNVVQEEAVATADPASGPAAAGRQRPH